MRDVHMNKWYSAHHLFVLLHEKYKICACSTVRMNWMGCKSNESDQIITKGAVVD